MVMYLQDIVSDSDWMSNTAQLWEKLSTLSEHLSRMVDSMPATKGSMGGANVLNQSSVCLEGALASERVCGLGSRFRQAVPQTTSLQRWKHNRSAASYHPDREKGVCGHVDTILSLPAILTACIQTSRQHALPDSQKL